MTLADIIQRTAARMSGVTVTRDPRFSTVCISDDAGAHEDILLQGEDADAFNDECETLWEKCRRST